ncbi:hypothetical protein NLC36_05045, partial [Candidatus Aminicenantes bacterium AC-335-L06]|nr:hypothetical protein [Candidatus Aminicenantes bacterium AC-335-L06]
TVQREVLKIYNILQISIIFYPAASEKDKKFALSSLWMAVNLGNFGTRARRGFGSLICIEEEPVNPYNILFVNKESNERRNWYQVNLRHIQNIFKSQLNFEVYLINKKLDEIGRIYKEYRIREYSTPDRKIFGLPIKGQSGLKPERFASQFIIKPLDKNNCLIVLNTNPILPKEWKNMGKNYFLKEIRGFINELNPTKIYP